MLRDRLAGGRRASPPSARRVAPSETRARARLLDPRASRSISPRVVSRRVRVASASAFASAFAFAFAFAFVFVFSRPQTKRRSRRRGASRGCKNARARAAAPVPAARASRAVAPARAAEARASVAPSRAAAQYPDARRRDVDVFEKNRRLAAAAELANPRRPDPLVARVFPKGKATARTSPRPRFVRVANPNPKRRVPKRNPTRSRPTKPRSPGESLSCLPPPPPP